MANKQEPWNFQRSKISQSNTLTWCRVLDPGRHICRPVDIGGNHASLLGPRCKAAKGVVQPDMPVRIWCSRFVQTAAGLGSNCKGQTGPFFVVRSNCLVCCESLLYYVLFGTRRRGGEEVPTDHCSVWSVDGLREGTMMQQQSE